MANEITLHPEELFFLADIMDAEYFDYDYISIMHEIGKHYDQMKTKCIQDLSRKGLIRKKMSGKIIVDDRVADVLKNIFHSPISSGIQIYSKDNNPEKYKFHIGEEKKITQVVIGENGLILCSIGKENLPDMISRLVVFHSERKVTVFSPEKVEKMINVYYADPQTGIRSMDLYEIEDALCSLDENEVLINYSDNEAVSLIVKMIAGG